MILFRMIHGDVFFHSLYFLFHFLLPRPTSFCFSLFRSITICLSVLPSAGSFLSRFTFYPPSTLSLFLSLHVSSLFSLLFNASIPAAQTNETQYEFCTTCKNTEIAFSSYCTVIITMNGASFCYPVFSSAILFPFFVTLLFLLSFTRINFYYPVYLLFLFIPFSYIFCK